MLISDQQKFKLNAYSSGTEHEIIFINLGLLKLKSWLISGDYMYLRRSSDRTEQSTRPLTGFGGGGGVGIIPVYKT